MKSFFLLLSACLSSYTLAMAQAPPMYQVSAGEIATDIIPSQEIYRYPSFTDGYISFHNGMLPSMKLNYSLLFNEMEFIGETGDTLAIANVQDIKEISIGEHQYFYLPKTGFVEVIAEMPQASLARNQSWQIKDRKDLIPRGLQWGRSPEIPTYRQVLTHKAPKDLKIRKETAYFIRDKNGRFYPAKQSTFRHLFRRNRHAVTDYIKAQKTNFRQEEDLLQLLEFCNQLGKR
jgi:hypothetical protein